MTIHITTHAIARYQERVANIPEAEVRVILTGPAIQKAAAFGAPYVRIATGQRVVLSEGKVVTVLPRGCWLNTLSVAAHRRRKS